MLASNYYNVDSRGKITGQGVATHQSQLNI